MGSHWEYWSPPKWGSEMVLLFLLLSAAITLSGGDPQTHRQIRAAPAFENVCKAAEEAYREARASGKSSKIASLISAKTFYVQFFDSKIKGQISSSSSSSSSSLSSLSSSSPTSS